MVANSTLLSETVAKYENSPINKTDVEVIILKMKLFEKKKIAYRITVSEVHNLDKKTIKKGTKVINNNKYILFNSWYTKNKAADWYSSHDMWNYMKNFTDSKLFIDIFDYIEKLGKSVQVTVKTDDTTATAIVPSPSTSGTEDDCKLPYATSSSPASRRKKIDINVENIKESNDRRLKLYEEFYKVLTIAFKTGSAPATSFIYDQTIKNSGSGGLEKLNKTIVQRGLEVFKNIVNHHHHHHPNVDATVTAVATVTNRKNSTYSEKSVNDDNCANDDIGDNDKVVVEVKRKRKHNSQTSFATKNKQAKHYRQPVTTITNVYAMKNDNQEDSQMSE